jgi:hypothetical protein
MILTFSDTTIWFSDTSQNLQTFKFSQMTVDDAAPPFDPTRRIHGQRISQPELIQESYAVMVELGTHHVLRAEFIAGLAKAIADPAAITKTEESVKAKAIAKSATPASARALAKRNTLVLSEQRAQVHPTETRAWREAFGLANQFLITQNLKHTLAATQAEFPNFSRFASETSGSQSSEHFDALVHSDSPPPAQRKTRQFARPPPEKTVQKGRPKLTRPAVPQDLLSSSAPGDSDG